MQLSGRSVRDILMQMSTVLFADLIISYIKKIYSLDYRLVIGDQSMQLPRRSVSKFNLFYRNIECPVCFTDD